MSNFEVRSYRDGDAASCRSLWAQLTEWHRDLYADPDIGGPDPGSRFDEHLERVGPKRLWVAQVARDVVGLGGLIVNGTEGELEPLVVDPDHRGRGIGAALTAAVVEAATAAGARLLGVRPVARNADAIAFFRKSGFDVLGHIELLMDLGGDQDRWRRGERLAGRDFRV